MVNIPQEFEDVFRDVELTQDEIRTLAWIIGWERRTVENLRSAIKRLRAELEQVKRENRQLKEKLHGMEKN